MPIRPPLLVTDLVNIRYLTGIPLSAGSVLVRQTRSMLFVDDRYLEHAGYGRRGMRVRHIRELPHVLGRIRRCGFEVEHVTVAQHDSWKKKFPRTRLVPCKDVIEYLRRQQRPDELSSLRRAEHITEELLRRIPVALRARPTERGLAWKLRLWAHEGGADSLAFEPIVAFGSHTSRPHHYPTERRLRGGDLVQVDVGAKYRGYCADRSAVYFTGEPTDAQRKVHTALQEALNVTKAAVRVGVTNRALDRLARRVLRRHGFEREFCHALGHGVGLDIHEGVTLSEKAPLTKLLHGEVIAIEPGLYFPGKFGMRLEEMVYVR